MDVLLAQPVLVAIFDKAFAGIDHKQPLLMVSQCIEGAGVGALFVDDDDAGRNTGAVEQVGRQTDDPLDIALLEQVLADTRLGIAAKQHAVWQDHRTLAGALQALDDVQQEGVIAVFLWRHAPDKAAELVVLGIEAASPVLVGEGRVGYGKVKGFELVVALLPLGCSQGVALPDCCSGVVVQDHVHPRQRTGGVVHLLSVNTQSLGAGLVARLEQQGARTTGGVVDGGILRGLTADTNHLGQNARHLGRGVELPLGLARLGGEVAHQVFVGITQQVIPFGAVGRQIQPLEDSHQLGETVDHLLALAEFVFIVEVGNGDHPLEIVGGGQRTDDGVDPLANLLAALERHHVVKARPGWYLDHGVRVALGLVGDVFHKQQGQHIVLVLGGIHPAAQLIAAGPEGGVEFVLLDSHGESGL
ncbi:hypothetical protein D3C76_595710 [compost metagenome]